MSEAVATESGPKSMDDIMALCKRRGFIYQASEIYGGINGFWDYGPLGALLKKNLRDAWWHDVIMMGCSGRTGPDGKPVRILPLDTCIIQNPKVWEASGHVAGFNDPMVDDRETKQRFRADHLVGLYPTTEDGETVEEIARRVADLNVSVLPDRTVVASSPLEAVQILEAEKKLRKALGIREFSPSISSRPPTATIDLGRGEVLYVLEMVPYLSLERHASEMPSPFTGKPGSLTPPRSFNLMFRTYIGATASEDDVAYLRPETAQGIFINFKNVIDTVRVRPPFGIANVGTAFRNEVTPRNFTFRSREFEQMECEFFCHPSESRGWYEFWRDYRMWWWESLGLKGENLRLREHEQDELSHYAKEGAGTCDVEYRYPFTHPDFGELEGIADRTNFDLRAHQEHSGVKMEYFDQERNEKYVPHCIEPAAGLSRGTLAVICEAYTPDPERPSKVYMKFHPRLAPIKAAVFPLVNKDGMPEVGEKLRNDLHQRFGAKGMIEFDAKQNIGKRYARMDEAGCPFCFTIDGQTMEDQTVTVRYRDTLQQERVHIDRVGDFLGEKLGI